MSSAVATPPAPAGAPLTKKVLTADHPTWCPGCVDFAVLACFYRVLEKLQYPHEKIVTFAGIGCSSRFPYFVNTHGGHFIHGRALPFAAGISLGNDELHVFVFGGDGAVQALPQSGHRTGDLGGPLGTRAFAERVAAHLD